MKRSEIRETFSADGLAPDCAALHPGYALTSLLPLWEKVARMQSAPDEGFSPRRETPHLASLREATLSHKGRG
ncbi:hypothetical protein XH92_08540 [Bradyrhizobium sp. CCBAU 53421]|nr:hypothetical protein XH92_08540 [Bradyrhizobium sp. CCBAU 53421]